MTSCPQDAYPLYGLSHCLDRPIPFLQYVPGAEEVGGFCNSSRWFFCVSVREFLIYDFHEGTTICHHTLPSRVTLIVPVLNYLFIALENTPSVYLYNCETDVFLKEPVDFVPQRFSNPTVIDLVISLIIIEYPFKTWLFSFNIETNKRCALVDVSLPSFRNFVSQDQPPTTVIRPSTLSLPCPYVDASLNGMPPFTLKFPLNLNTLSLLVYDPPYLNIGSSSGLFLRYNTQSREVLFCTAAVTHQKGSVRGVASIGHSFVVLVEDTQPQSITTHFCFFRVTDTNVVLQNAFSFAGEQHLLFTRCDGLFGTFIYSLLTKSLAGELHLNLFTPDGKAIVLNDVVQGPIIKGVVVAASTDPFYTSSFYNQFRDLFSAKHPSFLFLPQPFQLLTRVNETYSITEYMSTSRPLSMLNQYLSLLPSMLLCPCPEREDIIQFNELADELALAPYESPQTDKFVDAAMYNLFEFDRIAYLTSFIMDAQQDVDPQMLHCVVKFGYILYNGYVKNFSDLLLNQIEGISAGAFKHMTNKTLMALELFESSQEQGYMSYTHQLYQVYSFFSQLFPFFVILSEQPPTQPPTSLMRSFMSNKHGFPFLQPIATILVYATRRGLDNTILVYIRWLFEVYQVAHYFDRHPYVSFLQRAFDPNISLFALLILCYDMNDQKRFHAILQEAHASAAAFWRSMPEPFPLWLEAPPGSLCREADLPEYQKFRLFLDL